ncbi:MAG: hypothetical protein KDD65_11365 [Bacteroidetes bacterium]|nr:hypothetical protein [Bacteroidota bacterium]
MRLRLFKFVPAAFCVLLAAGVMPGETDAQDAGAGGSDQSLVSRLRPPVRFTGGLSVSGSAYTASGIEGRRSPYTYALNGSATLAIGKFTIPMNANFTEQSRDFAVSFRRYGLSPSWGWGKAHLGYRSLNFSSYTVGGATFLGGGLELNPGLLRFGALYGRFQKAREEDETIRLRPQYKRIGYGARIGIGKQRNYFDVIAFRAVDDTLSLDALPSNREIRPMENVVVGVNTSISPIRELRVFGETSVSVLNRDLTAAVADTAEVPGFILKLFTPRESVQASLAARAGVDVNTPMFGVTAEYQRIDPGYQSLGAYYFNTDVESFTITPRISVMQGRVSVALMGGIASNNLYGDLLETTRRLVSSINANVRTGDIFSVSAQFGNFSTDQRAGIREIVDSTRVETVSRNLSLSPRMRFVSETRAQTVTLRFAQQQFRQVSEITLVSSDADSRTFSASYDLRFKESDLGVRISGTQLNSTVGIRETVSRGINAGIEKALMDDALTAETRFGYRTRKVGDGDPAGTWTGDLGLTWVVSRNDSFSLRSNYGGRLIDPVADTRANELMITLSYSRRF